MGYKLTDILEVHFLELPKLFEDEILKDANNPIVQWMEFIDAKSKGVMEMLAEKMIKRGDSIEDIIELTELTSDKILELKRKYQH